MKTITIAMIGAGRATELHMHAYEKVHGVQLRYKYVFDALTEKAEKAKELYGFEKVAQSLDEILKDPDVDVIDVCTPPYTHKDLVIQGLKTEKHVICEKPLCGFFGPGDTDKKIMYESVMKDLNEIEEAVNTSSKQLFYAENWIYAPAIQKAAEIIKAKGSKILFAKGEESLAGSSSPVAGLWEKSGGGTLMRVGCHPLAAILWLKKINDSTSRVTKVVADIDRITDDLTDYEHRHINANPIDVEDHAVVCLTFSDETKAIVMACDTCLGGSKNYLELYCNDSVIQCNLTMNNSMSTYFLDEDGMDDIELSEMLHTKCGWNNSFVSDEIMRGYVNEMQDFLDCVCDDQKQPIVNFGLAKTIMLTIYESYMAPFNGLKGYASN